MTAAQKLLDLIRRRRRALRCATAASLFVLAGGYPLSILGQTEPPPQPGYPAAGQPAPQAGYPAPGYDDGQPTRQLSAREQRCIQLERALVNQGRGQAQSVLPRLYAEQRKLEGVYQRAQRKADRSNCYEQFLFSKTLRRTRKCLRLHNEIQQTGRRLAIIKRDIDGLRNRASGNRRRQELINALAQNGCGGVYKRQARRRQKSWNPFSAFFGGDNEYDTYYDNAPRRMEPETGIRADATYRTMCVRRCDGYYFPISYQTLPSRFGRDSDACQSRCAAPASLYVYRNPGGESEQMISLQGAPYAGMPNAYRYRQEYIKSCSCKEEVYDPLDPEMQTSDAEGPLHDGQAGVAAAQPAPIDNRATRAPERQQPRRTKRVQSPSPPGWSHTWPTVDR